jgi:hypothetical protein
MNHHFTSEEIDRLVIRGMIESGSSLQEATQVFGDATPEKLQRMRAGAIAVIRGLISLGWQLAPPEPPSAGCRH